jgi:hypothetical protein
MLKNLFKATKYHFDSRERNFNVWCILTKGWLAWLKGYNMSLKNLFQHTCLTNQTELMQPAGNLSFLRKQESRTNQQYKVF